jgi:ABC-2 type transport system ATP-binding protein
MRERLLGHLSKGYRQRVGLAQALCGDPDVLVLDEPTVGLDPKQITEIRALIRRLGAGKTILFSSHNLGEVRQLCDRVVILHRGEVKLDAPIGEVGGHDAVTLLCTVQGSEKRLTAAMSRLDGVRSVSVQPGADEDKVAFSLSFDPSTLPEKQVFTLCSAMSAPILRMARCEDDLEQVFLKAIAE